MNGRSHARLWVALVFAAAVVLYGRLPSRLYSNDDLQYALIITRASTGARLFHPGGGWKYVPAREDVREAFQFSPNARYILEWPTSLAAVRLWHALGWQGDVIDPILSVRALAGALGLALFFVALGTATGRPGIALIATIGLGTTASYWTYSTHVDQSIIMTMWIAAALLILVARLGSKTSPTRQLLLVASLVLASLYNLTASITAFIFIAGLSLSERDAPAGRRLFVRLGGMYVLSVVAVIMVVLAVNSRSIVDPSYWRGAVFAGKPEYGVLPIRDLARAVIGLAKSQILYPGVTGSLQSYWTDLGTTARVVFGAFYLMIAALMAGPLVMLAIERRRMTDERRRLAGALLSWFTAYFVFNWLWDPGYNKYWLLPLVAWWASAALFITHVWQTDSQRGKATAAALLTLALASATNNLLTQFLPESRPSNNPWRRIAVSLSTASSPDALFISPQHPLDFSLALFGGRDVLAIGLLDRNAGGDQRQVAALVSTHVTDHRLVGGSVYVYGFEGLDRDKRRKFFELLGGNTVRPGWTFPEVTISELVR